MNTIFVDANYDVNARLLHVDDLVQQRYDAVQLMTVLARLKKWMFAPAEKKEIWLEMPVVIWWWNCGRPFFPALLAYFRALDVEVANRKPDAGRSDVDQICDFLARKKNDYDTGKPLVTPDIVDFFKGYLAAKRPDFYTAWAATSADEHYPVHFSRVRYSTQQSVSPPETPMENLQ